MRNLPVLLLALLSVACSGEPEGQAQPSIAANGAETQVEESPAVDVLAENQAQTSVATDGEKPRAAPSLPADEPKPTASQSVAVFAARDTATLWRSPRKSPARTW